MTAPEDRGSTTHLEVVPGPDGQLTLPSRLCDALGIRAGERLEVSLADGRLLVKSRKVAGLSALDQLQRAFAESGVPEEEWQAEARRVRDEIFHERYGGA